MLVTGWRKLIQLDCDPDKLKEFLQAHSSWLNVEFLIYILPYTVSLDRYVIQSRDTNGSLVATCIAYIKLHLHVLHVSPCRSLKRVVSWTSVEVGIKSYRLHSKKSLIHMDVEDVVSMVSIASCYASGSSCRNIGNKPGWKNFWGGQEKWAIRHRTCIISDTSVFGHVNQMTTSK